MKGREILMGLLAIFALLFVIGASLSTGELAMRFLLRAILCLVIGIYVEHATVR